MRILTEMPESGRFVIVWEYDGQIQSGTYLRNKDLLMDLNTEDEDYTIHASSGVFKQKTTFFVVSDNITF